MTRTPPKLTRPAYHVWMLPEGAEPDDVVPDDELVYCYVVVNHSDQLRAELEGRQHGLSKPQETPMHLTSLWLWAALVRTGRYDGKFAAFKTACLAYDPDRDDDGKHTGQEPDPTTASTS